MPEYDVCVVVKGVTEGRWFYFNGRPMHPSFLGSMSILLVNGMAKRGAIYPALPYAPPCAHTFADDDCGHPACQGTDVPF